MGKRWKRAKDNHSKGMGNGWETDGKEIGKEWERTRDRHGKESKKWEWTRDEHGKGM